MRITKEQLKQIIKEELELVLTEMQRPDLQTYKRAMKNRPQKNQPDMTSVDQGADQGADLEQPQKDTKAAGRTPREKQGAENIRKALGLGNKGMDWNEDSRFLLLMYKENLTLADFADMQPRDIRKFAKKARVKARFGMSGMKQWAGFEE
tara:strand:+ start:100 stop:549 length:450 start_codon:yes stop_codon:yes gene_type:complete